MDPNVGVALKKAQQVLPDLLQLSDFIHRALFTSFCLRPVSTDAVSER